MSAKGDVMTDSLMASKCFTISWFSEESKLSKNTVSWQTHQRARKYLITGVEHSIIDSSNWLATMSGLFNCLQTWTILCCFDETCSKGICAPRSPLATIAPTNAWMNFSRFHDSILSIIAITHVWPTERRYVNRSPPHSSAVILISIELKSETTSFSIFSCTHK